MDTIHKPEVKTTQNTSCKICKLVEEFRKYSITFSTLLWWSIMVEEFVRVLEEAYRAIANMNHLG